MGVFDKIKEPIFLKENNSAEQQLAALKELHEKASGQLAEQIEQDIKLIEAGIFGENTIIYELRNSHIPMFVLHDLYLEFGDLSAQIDFLIITRKHYFVVECKNLFGNIEITSSGDFIRTMTFGLHTRKEGIYSPITQNRRHLELIKQIRGAEKNNLLSKVLFEKNFYSNYKSIVVLANPKTILNAKYAKKEIRDQVIRADQLSEYIRKIDADPDSIASSEKDMEALARYFLGLHKPQSIDYASKYREVIEVKNEENSEPEQVETISKISCPKCRAEMILRKAAKGSNAGKEFYGCPNFPKCRGFISIDTI